MIGVGELRDDLRGLVGEADDPVAMLEVHGKERARPHLVEAHGQPVAGPPERVFDPRARLVLDETLGAHLEVHHPEGIGQPRRPRDLDVADGRGEPEGATLADEGHEGRPPGNRLGPPVLAHVVEAAREERDASFAERDEPALLHELRQGAVGLAQARLVEDLARPEKEQILVEIDHRSLRRDDEAPEDVDAHRTE